MAANAKLTTLIEPVVGSMGYEFVGVEFISQGRHSVLRVYIDKPNGIDIDDCSTVSRQLSGLLDVEDPISGEYHLEVSSPGLDRPLFTLAHFEKFIGHECIIRMKVPVDGQRKFSGVIKSLLDGSIELATKEKGVLLRYENIDKANLVPEY